jgi:hypothetical protein
VRVLHPGLLDPVVALWYEFVESKMTRLEEEIAERLRPF